MVLARAISCSKQKSSSCSPASFVSPKPYSPTADDISVISCKMLKKTEAWHQKYAVFRVVVNVADKDNVFDDGVWPVEIGGLHNASHNGSIY